MEVVHTTLMASVSFISMIMEPNHFGTWLNYSTFFFFEREFTKRRETKWIQTIHTPPQKKNYYYIPGLSIYCELQTVVLLGLRTYMRQ